MVRNSTFGQKVFSTVIPLLAEIVNHLVESREIEGLIGDVPVVMTFFASRLQDYVANLFWWEPLPMDAVEPTFVVEMVDIDGVSSMAEFALGVLGLDLSGAGLPLFRLQKLVIRSLVILIMQNDSRVNEGWKIR